MQYYWELTQFDGTQIEIPPDSVDVVKRRMASGDPINTRTAVIPVNQIKSFRITDKIYNPQRLLEDVSQAFREPIIDEDGSIKSKWVKKEVTQDKWNKFYSQQQSYRSLGESGGMVIIAFKQPVHQIDHNVVSECSAEDVDKLENKY